MRLHSKLVVCVQMGARGHWDGAKLQALRSYFIRNSMKREKRGWLAGYLHGY